MMVEKSMRLPGDLGRIGRCKGKGFEDHLSYTHFTTIHIQARQHCATYIYQLQDEKDRDNIGYKKTIYLFANNWKKPLLGSRSLLFFLFLVNDII